MKQLLILLSSVTLATAATSSDPLAPKAAAILEQRCLACHSDKTAMSELRLTGREDALRGGKHGPAIKPGSK